MALRTSICWGWEAFRVVSHLRGKSGGQFSAKLGLRKRLEPPFEGAVDLLKNGVVYGPEEGPRYVRTLLAGFASRNPSLTGPPATARKAVTTLLQNNPTLDMPSTKVEAKSQMPSGTMTGSRMS